MMTFYLLLLLCLIILASRQEQSFVNQYFTHSPYFFVINTSLQWISFIMLGLYVLATLFVIEQDNYAWLTFACASSLTARLHCWHDKILLKIPAILAYYLLLLSTAILFYILGIHQLLALSTEFAPYSLGIFILLWLVTNIFLLGVAHKI